MDAFFAAVEIRDAPHLAHQPVIVGGAPNERGVVATANYIARKFKIHSAMSCSKAYRLCPHAVFIKPQFEKYRAISQTIRAIFLRYTQLVEPVALDEAYLDVTQNHFNLPSATWVAKRIRQTIWDETQLIASAGVSSNKMLAKLACEHQKPNGLFTIKPEQVLDFLAPLPASVISGVGPATLRQLQNLKANTIYRLRQLPLALLVNHFGKRGQWLYHAARGIDDRPVQTNRPRKSVSVETTFEQDIANPLQQQAQLQALCQRLYQRMARPPALLPTQRPLGRTVVLKMRLSNFRTHTRSITPSNPLTTLKQIQTLAANLLVESGMLGKPMRLIGLGLQLPQTPKPNSPLAQAQLQFAW